ncbi:hypothetical protein MHC_00880 [Mycoplasma haemocanis str. Illinois]|uniref:Uncharacterized protein n=1 Tax=Mycoplasma haemocanis (strain Illinois) TaxID=1111676 RepID=H6N5T2_MYCHN|nr:hypothetical protein [Mycoplasma haemocanis]AEW45042.1 hypothetical protein MHC_00880 [Mycoplasma haemocanis str. Illinois]
MSPTKICALTLGGGGVTISATYGMYYKTNSERTVKSEISGILLTKESEDEAWGQHYEKYKQSKNNLKIRNLDSSSETAWKEGIKKWCSEALEIRWTNSDFYETVEKAKQWCLDTESIGDRINRTLDTGKEVIPDSASDGEWSSAWDKYNTGKGSNEIEALKDTNNTGGKGKIKTWCTDNKHLNASAHKDLKNSMKSWCTKDKITSSSSAGGVGA